jgi:hypothetical protein
MLGGGHGQSKTVDKTNPLRIRENVFNATLFNAGFALLPRNALRTQHLGVHDADQPTPIIVQVMGVKYG